MKPKPLTILVAAVAAGGLGVAGATVALSRPAFDEAAAPLPLALPPAEVGAAIARTEGRTLVLTAVLTAAGETSVEGVEVDGEPLAVAAMGVDRLLALAAEGDPVTVPLSALESPVPTDLGAHVAAGTNYADHADEVALEAPFLFPKLSRPTAWSAPVPASGRLDYEVELCAVALDDLSGWRADAVGFVLCGDFTDRWALLSNLDLSGTMGETGFAEGKGGPGRLPVGPWLVVPRDAGAFHAQVELRLSVDGRLRQRSSAAEMTWSPEAIVARALDACGGDFRERGEPAPWPACDHIPAGTLLLTGTPAGVIFRPFNVWAGWLYLQPEQTVVGEGTWLGRTVSQVQ